MNLFLSKRNKTLVEHMDVPDCDLIRLENTYKHFGLINKLLSGWKRIYSRFIRPVLQQNTEASILDIGFGGGDVCETLLHFARNDGFNPQILGIELDERALQFVQKYRPKTEVVYRIQSAEDLLKTGAHFDVVISNHVLHHLHESYLPSFLETSGNLGSVVIHNDIRRDVLALLSYPLLAAPFHFHTFLLMDGSMSIMRSFTPHELELLLPPKFSVEPMPLFRNLVIKNPDRD